MEKFIFSTIEFYKKALKFCFSKKENGYSPLAKVFIGCMGGAIVMIFVTQKFNQPIFKSMANLFIVISMGVFFLSMPIFVVDKKESKMISFLTKAKHKNIYTLIQAFSHQSYVLLLCWFTLYFSIVLIASCMYICVLFSLLFPYILVKNYLELIIKNSPLVMLGIAYIFTFFYFNLQYYYFKVDREEIKRKIDLYAAILATLILVSRIFLPIDCIIIILTGMTVVYTWLKYTIEGKREERNI